MYLTGNPTTPIPPLDTLPIYNILLLGPTQSGKSTFIEFAKKYADPSYTINTRLTGAGNWSWTQEVRSEVVVTNLPIYKLYDRDESDGSTDGGQEININAILSQSILKPFKKLLDRDDDLEARPEVIPGSEWVRFRLIDTPGLDDTQGDDLRNLCKIFKALSTVNKFSLVLIFDANQAFLKSQVEAFETYFRLFEELNGLTIIVHTKVPNINRHSSKKALPDKLAERSKFFSKIAGRSIPATWIDCDVEEHGPANTCLTRNTIRNILEIAMFKTPISRNKTSIRKTPKMAAMDNVLHEQCQKKFQSAKVSFAALNEIDQLYIEIRKTEQQIRCMEKSIENYDTDDPVVLFEECFGEEWRFFGRVKTHILEFPSQEFTIIKKTMVQRSIKLLDETGGQGEKHWHLRFSRESFATGLFYVNLSTTSRIKHKKRIKEWNGILDSLKSILNDLRKRQSEQENIARGGGGETGSSELKQQLEFELALYSMIIGHAKADNLPAGLFLELANAGIYQNCSNVDQSAQDLERHYEKLHREKSELVLKRTPPWLLMYRS
ncbi:hypothetical protein B0O80DRAFT_141141 [Mortierella sp. GBAus27b]|nr:hypothetical protein B0O80DRAFT_141141 [Mortierella sp. GBAus27b]